MPSYYFDLQGVSPNLKFGATGGVMLWNIDHFESTSDGSTLAVHRVATPVVNDDAVNKGYVDTEITNIAKPYDICVFFPNEADASDQILEFVAPRTVTLPDDFAGSTGFVETNPASNYVMDVERNGVVFGNITIDTAGVFTFVTTGSVPEILNTGDRLTVRAPSVQDGTINTIVMTLVGER